MSPLWLVCVTAAWAAAVAAAAAGCGAAPPGAGPKSPGDNHYRLVINGDVERYRPGERYVVTLVGSRTHDRVQQFTRFRLRAEPQSPAPGAAAAAAAPAATGQFHLFADTLTTFDPACTNAVAEADDLPKTEVLVMWRAPPPGSGCVLLKALVAEADGRWFEEDGQLTRRVCEDVSAAAECCACDDAKYKMVFEGLWSARTHPKDFPTQALWLTHFSDVIGASHTSNYSFWGEGKIASDGFRSLAEWGSVGLMERELRQQGALLRSIVKAPGLWHPRVNSNTSAVFSVDRRRHRVSLASMFGPSPDWVVGVSGLELCLKNCSWVESQVIDLFPWDAGTDSGVSYMSPNAETVPRERMHRITPMYPEDPRAPFYRPGAAEVPPMARLHLARTQLVPRGCDRDTLQALLAEEPESDQAAERPECAVSAWGAWSPCSVSCGKGLRMRAREYALPQKALMLGCERQLVSKEMCVAAVAECDEPAPAAAEASDVAPAAAAGPACATGPWGAWSECSVTCGVGVSTRRRAFLDRMGPKKCPLVDTEENRKCMQPACEEAAAAAAAADPECPTLEWSAWSPCSASCGRGVRARMRLLLVAPERQRACAERVELLQHQPCAEREDCRLDMLTAKQICMEAADAGPCRGVYPRWAFAAPKGMCVSFQYGGCRGNRNNFLTQEDCAATCQALLGGAPAPAPAAESGAGAVGAAGPDGCQWGPWSEWGRCSVSCGLGHQERRRQLLNLEMKEQCPARLARRRRRCHKLC